MVKNWGWLSVLFVLSASGYSYIEKVPVEHTVISDCRVEQERLEEAELLEASLKEVIREIEDITESTSQIHILDLQYDYPMLIINLSKEIVCYGGGNEMEYQVVARLLEWGFENTLAETMEIYIEGSNMLFPEGSMSMPCSREHYEIYFSQYD